MSTFSHAIDPTLYEYLLAHSLQEAPILKKLREETSHLPGAQMQISPEQGQFMAMLVKLTGAKRILEVGTFTGYSSLAMALALPDEGRLITLDRDPRATEVAKRYWEEAGVADRVSLKLGPAIEMLETLKGPFDLAFIDADKAGYAHYYEKVLQLIRPGGLILLDNVFMHGKVLSPDPSDKAPLAIHAFNRALHQDKRVEISMLPIADGLTLARKSSKANT